MLNLRTLAASLALGAVLALPASAQTVGYFTDFNEFTTDPAAGITAAGMTPVQITDISTFNLGTINILAINEAANGAASAALLARMGDIDAWVAAGGCFIVHDRGVAQGGTPNPLLLGGAGIALTTSFDSDLDFSGSSLVNGGPAGALSDTDLDGGNLSSHGYADASSLPGSAEQILNVGGIANNVAAFAYNYGLGGEYYSTIPLDFYLSGSGNNPPADNIRNIYWPNVLAYVADRWGSPQNEVPEPGTYAMLIGAGFGTLVMFRRRK